MLHDIPAIGTIYYCVATVAAGVFVGASTALAVSAYGAAVDSNSMEEFADQGQAALVSTMVGGAAGGASAYNYPGHNCFVAGTAVLTSIGARNIETVQPGDLVWAWDEDTGDVSLKKVVETYVNETDELVHIWADGEEIVATPSHPFYSPVKGWTEACELRAGDILVLVNGEYVVVEQVQHELLESPVKVYNFQVEDYHTYYVGSGVLVHNKCKRSGSYEIEFESGKNYVGKGDEARMRTSASQHSAKYNDPVVSMQWEYAPTAKEAFVSEYFKMAVRGVNNPNTYNLIWSPGRKYFIDIWR